MTVGEWLRIQREARGWSQREMARRLIQAGRACGDTHMPALDSMYRNVHRWEAGQTSPLERFRLYYCKAFGIPPDQFGIAPPSAAQPDNAASPAPARPAAPLPASTTVAYRGTYGPGLGRFTVEREVTMTAHEASDHAEQYESSVGETTVEQIRADMTRLARLAPDTSEPLAVFLDMRRVRDRIYRALDRRPRPGQQTDLHFMLGCLNGLMGGTANCLGYPDAAEELTRAGWASATTIDHRPLLGRLRLALSVVMYERGRFEEARDLAASGLTYISAGPTGANLHLKHAQAAARVGDADTARQAVRDAHEARDRDQHDELVDIGGSFLVSRATHYGFAGAALTALAGAEREAAQELEQAISCYDQGPGEREQHWFAGKPLASIDLAVVRLRSGALDAAAEALEPALSLPAAQRINRVTSRMAAARAELAAPIFRGAVQARDLGARIEEFGRETAIAGLHSLTGGPG